MQESGSGEGPSRKEISPRIEPRGEVVLGHQNPKGLTPEQFVNSPDVLWHGSAEPLEYSPNFDVYDKPNEVSNTAGFGFYATDRKEEAAVFSKYRMRRDASGNYPSEPIVTPLLPYKARMFDFRSIDDPTVNGDVPVSMVKGYRNYYQAAFDRRYPDGKPNGYMGMIYETEKEYLDQLHALDGEKPLDLRHMLSRDVGILKRNDTYGMAVGQFTNYMRDNGYDGVIYVEAGDIPAEQNNPPSFVFYNLEKVGTQEAWEKSKI